MVYRRTPVEVTVFAPWRMASESGSWTGSWTAPDAKVSIGKRYFATWHEIAGHWLVESETYMPDRCAGSAYCAAQAGGAAPVPLSELRQAPLAITVGGRRLSLSTVMWRDFMPTAPGTPDRHPLSGSLRVAAADGKAFPPGVKVDRAWILFDDKSWEVPAPLEEQDAQDPSYKNAQGVYANRPDSPTFAVVARGGPSAGPEASVEVVVRVTDGKGRHFLLRAAGQKIGRVD